MDKKLLREKDFDAIFIVKEYEIKDGFLYELDIQGELENDIILQEKTPLNLVYKLLYYFSDRVKEYKKTLPKFNVLNLVDFWSNKAMRYDRQKYHLLLDELLDERPNLDEQRDESGRTALHLACKEGLSDVIEKLLPHIDPNICDDKGDQALMYAVNFAWRAKTTFLEPIYRLANATKDINNLGIAKDSDTALGWATKYGGNSASVVTILLENGAKPNKKNHKGETPLMHAASSDRLDLVKLLLIYGADTTLKDENGNTALDIAKKENRQSVVEFLTRLEKE